MLKISFTVIIVAFSMSCSSNDDMISGPARPAATLPVANKLTISGPNGNDNKVLEFHYDNLHRIDRIIRTGYVPKTFIITYNEGSGITSIDNGSAFITFYYDDYGFTAYNDGTTHSITRSGANTFSSPEFSFSLNLKGDLEVFNGLIFFHDNTIKGPFNVVSSNTYLLGLFVDDAFIYVGSHIPVTKIAAKSDNNYGTYQYTYNSDGYVENIIYADPARSFEVSVEYTAFDVINI